MDQLTEMNRQGGPAFPVTDASKTQCPGMTLRDWFAGQALAGLCAAGKPVHINGRPRNHEVASYALADAMLIQRGKPPGEW